MLFGPNCMDNKCIHVYTSRKNKQNNPGILTMFVSRLWLYRFYFLFFCMFHTFYSKYVLLLQSEK